MPVTGSTPEVLEQGGRCSSGTSLQGLELDTPVRSASREVAGPSHDGQPPPVELPGLPGAGVLHGVGQHEVAVIGPHDVGLEAQREVVVEAEEPPAHASAVGISVEAGRRACPSGWASHWPMVKTDMAGVLRVLIVDDHEMFSEALALLFGREPGIELVASLPAGEAVVRCREEAPDVVLMDIDLPGIDGIEATRRIRAASPGTKVVVLPCRTPR
jgi:CheY-like chemotaxis protein